MENKLYCKNCNKNEVPAYRKTLCDGCAKFMKEEYEAKKQSVPEKPVEPEVSVGYHLTEENIRSNALRCAIEYFFSPEQAEKDQFWYKVKEFEKYIRGE